MDLVDVPVLTDRILDFLFSLSERAWYEASEEMVFNAFELIFLPWVDGNLYLQTDMKEFQDDIQTLLWHVMSNQHFTPLVKGIYFNEQQFKSFFQNTPKETEKFFKLIKTIFVAPRMILEYLLLQKLNLRTVGGV